MSDFEPGLYRRRTEGVGDFHDADRIQTWHYEYYRDEQAEAAVAAWGRVEAFLYSWPCPSNWTRPDLLRKLAHEHAMQRDVATAGLYEALADMLDTTAGGKEDGDG